MKPLFVSIPHSGERVAPETPWLGGLPEPVLMRDVDRFVDRLYEPALKELGIPLVKTEWHRYVVDLNRAKEDVDSESVKGQAAPAGSFPRGRGLHWVKTTLGEMLLPEPLSPELHNRLLEKYFEPFHRDVRAQFEAFRATGHKTVFQLDLHSMPSLGTTEHRDPGEYRKDVVISDCKGQSCSKRFLGLVTEAFTNAGFSSSYNWPYFGGRVTETYGHPSRGQEAIQVELNRALYMDETTKQLLPQKAAEIQPRLRQAIKTILEGVDALAGR